MKTKKTFDCVKMKRRAAEKLAAALADMTMDEKLAFWRRRTDELRERQKELAVRNAGRQRQ